MNSKWIMAIIVLLVIMLGSVWPRDNYLEVDFLDIGQGDATLIRTPQGQNILIDGGPDNSLLSQVAASLPWWEREIDYVIVTRWHEDHFAGLIELFNKYKVKNILATGHQPSEDFLYQTWLAALAKHGLSTQVLEPGQKFIVSTDLYWQVLSADTSHEDYNENSLVVRLTFDQVDFLFMGDLPSGGENKLLAQDWNLDSEILKVGHHGSKYSSGSDFLQAVEPELCIIESGVDNKFGHPHQEALGRLRDIGCQIWNTQDGPLKLISDGQSWAVDK